MKKRNVIGVVAFLGLALGSCSTAEENDAASEAFQPKEADAVAVISSSFAKASGGEAKEIEVMLQNMEPKFLPFGNGPGSGVVQGNLECNAPFDTTVTYSLSGSATGSYTHQWTFLLLCEGDVPVSLQVDAVCNGNFAGPNLQRAVNGARQRMWTGLGPMEPSYFVNGTSVRNGSQTHLFGPGNSFAWVLHKNAVDIAIDKETHQILSGTVYIDGTLSASNGNQFAFEAVLVFNGDGTATLTINGNVYTITL